VTIRWINAEILEDGPENNRVAKSDKKIDEVLRELDGILVPGAFGSRGIAGKMAGIKYAREHRLPYFGICFGLQLAVIEFAQNVLGIASASSSEFGSTNNPVIGLMTEWRRGEQIETRKEDGDLGGTMRLGLYECHLSLGSLAHKIYGKDVVNERHRHRYEVNMSYRARLESKGMKFSGLSPDGALTEVIEVNDHPWFLAMQCHPEFQSRPFDPHPAFTSFIEAALEYKSEKHKAT
jgi:CTP synthase